MLKAWIESSTPSSSVLTWNGKTAPLSYLHKQLDITRTRFGLTGTIQFITFLVVQPWLDFPSPRVTAVKIWLRGGPMNATAFVSGKVWVWLRMRSPALVMLVIVLGLLLYVGCGGSPSTPQARVYSGSGYPFVADFNQDGKADVFTAPTFGDSSGTMNLGGGNGDFQAATRVPLPTGV